MNMKKKIIIAVAACTALSVPATMLGVHHVHHQRDAQRECASHRDAATAAFTTATSAKDSFTAAIDKYRGDVDAPVTLAAQSQLAQATVNPVPECGGSVTAATLTDYVTTVEGSKARIDTARTQFDKAVLDARIAKANTQWAEADTLRTPVLGELDAAILAAQAKEGFASDILTQAVAARDMLKGIAKTVDITTLDQSTQLFQDAITLKERCADTRNLIESLNTAVAAYTPPAAPAPEPEPTYTAPAEQAPASNGYVAPAPGGNSGGTYAPAPVPAQPAPAQPAPAPAPVQPAPVQPAPAPAPAPTSGEVKGYVGMVCDGADTLRMSVEAGWTEEAARAMAASRNCKAFRIG